MTVYTITGEDVAEFRGVVLGLLKRDGGQNVLRELIRQEAWALCGQSEKLPADLFLAFDFATMQLVSAKRLWYTVDERGNHFLSLVPQVERVLSPQLSLV
jgi:hypothetical protein